MSAHSGAYVSHGTNSSGAYLCHCWLSPGMHLHAHLWECTSHTLGKSQAGTSREKAARLQEENGWPGKGCRSCSPSERCLSSVRRVPHRILHTLKVCTSCVWGASHGVMESAASSSARSEKLALKESWQTVGEAREDQQQRVAGRDQQNQPCLQAREDWQWSRQAGEDRQQ